MVVGDAATKVGSLDEALSFCKRMGGKIATPTSLDTYNSFYKPSFFLGNRYIGMRDPTDQASGLKYLDGENFTLTNPSPVGRNLSLSTSTIVCPHFFTPRKRGLP